MSNIDRLDREAKEYFYSLPLTVQNIILNSNKDITCREDMQRYFSNLVSNVKNASEYNSTSTNTFIGESNALVSGSNLF